MSRVRGGLNRQIVKSRARMNKTSVQPARKISILVRGLEQSRAVSNCSLVDNYRQQQLEQMKKRLGEYGEPLMVREYKQLRMMFDSGCLCVGRPVWGVPVCVVSHHQPTGDVPAPG